jgi:hypothetical protein
VVVPTTTTSTAPPTTPTTAPQTKPAVYTLQNDNWTVHVPLHSRIDVRLVCAGSVWNRARSSDSTVVNPTGPAPALGDVVADSYFVAAAVGKAVVSSFAALPCPPPTPAGSASSFKLIVIVGS